tara:strand:- start:39 stop:566 length:528 start_codon:yes stop_codon:yes gene_type:complete
MRTYVLSVISILALQGCSSAGTTNVEYIDFRKSVEVQRSVDVVWGDVLEWATINGFPVTKTDKSASVIGISGSGIAKNDDIGGVYAGGVTTDEAFVSCGDATGNIGLYKAKFVDMNISVNVFMRDLGESTRVSINLVGNATVEVRNGYGVQSRTGNTCPSRGVFEGMLFKYLEAL